MDIIREWASSIWADIWRQWRVNPFLTVHESNAWKCNGISTNMKKMRGQTKTKQRNKNKCTNSIYFYIYAFIQPNRNNIYIFKRATELWFYDYSVPFFHFFSFIMCALDLCICSIQFTIPDPDDMRFSISKTYTVIIFEYASAQLVHENYDSRIKTVSCMRCTALNRAHSSNIWNVLFHTQMIFKFSE